MATYNEYYVDASLGDDTTGAGTVGSPWQTIQKAVTTGTAGTHGKRINLRNNAAHNTTTAVTGLSSAIDKYTIFQGYTTTAGDGGFASWDGNGATLVNESAARGVIFRDLKMSNAGAANFGVSMQRSAVFERCELIGPCSRWLEQTITAGSCFAYRCVFTDCPPGELYLRGCYLRDAASADCTTVYGLIRTISYGAGVSLGNPFGPVDSCTIVAAPGSETATGLLMSRTLETPLVNTIISGFSGVGGKGINCTSTINVGPILAAFTIHNCTTPLTPSDPTNLWGVVELNETVGSDPIVRAGAIPTDITSATFWAELEAYFAPASVGSVRTASKYGSVRGAVPLSVGGGGSGRGVEIHSPYAIGGLHL